MKLLFIDKVSFNKIILTSNFYSELLIKYLKYYIHLDIFTFFVICSHA